MSTIAEKDTTILSYYNSLLVNDASSAATTLRLFQRGTAPVSYIALGSWAELIARQYIKSSTVLRNWGGGAEEQRQQQQQQRPLYAVSINEATAKEAVKDALLHSGVSCELHAAASGKWQRTHAGSPGCVGDFEDILFSVTSDVDVQLASLACLSFKSDPAVAGSYIVGVAFVNPGLRRIQVSEFVDSQQLVHTDAFVTQFSLKEVVISAAHGENDKSPVYAGIKRICGRLGISHRAISNAHFTAPSGGGGGGGSGNSDLERKLCQLLKVKEEKMELMSLPEATKAVSALLATTSLNNDDSNLGSFALRRIQVESLMRLDASAIEALNIVARGKEAGHGKLPVSIFGMLNTCGTGMGSRLMRQWLLQPLRDAAEINKRLAMVEAFVDSPAAREGLRTQVFRQCVDLDRVNRKLQRGACSLKEVLSLKVFADLLPAVHSICEAQLLPCSRNADDIRAEYLAPLKEMADHMENLRILIDSTIDSGHSGRECRIRPEFDDDLVELDDQLRAISGRIKQEYQHALRHFKWSDKILKSEYHPTYGHVLRVPRKEDKQVRESKTLTVVSTAKDGVRFVTEGLSGANQEYTEVNKVYEKRQTLLQRKLVETAATYLPVLDDAKELIAKFDVFCSWASTVSQSRLPMVRPVILPPETNTLKLTNLRHSLIEVRQPTAEFVPNTVTLSHPTTAMIITGPNMGGKSTVMRSVGVAVVLAQAGCFVPAEHAEISLRDTILCRVGATDYLSQGVSTFMVEMLESSAILAAATSQSLVIVDELGRGTSTYDGFGLAWSITEYLATTTRCILMFATHFHEMTHMAEEYRNVVNVHVRAEVDGAENKILRFLYKLEQGPCERSFGISVAEMAKIPPNVIQEAKAKAAELENFSHASTMEHRGSTEAAASDGTSSGSGASPPSPPASGSGQSAATSQHHHKRHVSTRLDSELGRKLTYFAGKIAELGKKDAAAAAALRQEIRGDDVVKKVLW